MMRRTGPLFIALAVFMNAASAPSDPAAAGSAGEQSEQDEARRALQAGEIVPLSKILAEVEGRFRGKLVEIELEHDETTDGAAKRLIYEIEILTPEGDLVEAIYDARTGAFLSVAPEEDDEDGDE